MKTKFLGLLMVVFLLAGCYAPATVETVPTAQPPTAVAAYLRHHARPACISQPAHPRTRRCLHRQPACPRTRRCLHRQLVHLPQAQYDATQTAVPPVTQAPKSLVEYAITLTGIVKSGNAALRRDEPLLIAAGIIPRREFDPDLLGGIEIPTTQDPAAACGGAQTPHPTLVADAALMRTLHEQLSAIKPPDQVVDWVHKPLLNAVEQWGNALDKIKRIVCNDQHYGTRAPPCRSEIGTGRGFRQLRGCQHGGEPDLHLDGIDRRCRSDHRRRDVWRRCRRRFAMREAGHLPSGRTASGRGAGKR